MMLRIVCIVLFFGLARAFAYEEAWTSNLFTDSRFSYLKVAGYDDKGFFLVGSNISFRTDRDRVGFTKRKFAVAYYTDDLQKQWEQYLDLFDDEKVVAFTALADKILFLYTRELRKDNKTEIFARQIGADGAFSKPTLITTIELSGNSLPDDFYLSSSKNNKMLLLSFNSEENKNETRINIIAFNDSLKSNFNSTFVVPYGNKNYYFINQGISNNGDVFLLGSNNPLNKRIKDPSDLKNFLITGNKAFPSGRILEISFPDKFISDIGLAIDELNNNVVVAGYYSESNPYSYAGVFYSAFDIATGEMKILREDKFPEKVLVKMFGEIKGRKNKELNTFSIDKIILRSDGGAVVLSEAKYTTSNSYYDNFTRSYVTSTNYYYNNILAVSMNANGTIDWPVVIPKNQVTVNDFGYYSSYCMAVDDNKMHFIYNRFSGSKSNGMMYSVAANGEEQFTQLFSNQEEATLMPGGALQIDDNVIIIPAIHKRKVSLLKLTL